MRVTLSAKSDSTRAASNPAMLAPIITARTKGWTPKSQKFVGGTTIGFEGIQTFESAAVRPCNLKVRESKTLTTLTARRLTLGRFYVVR